jgi:hypothetical protein
MSLECACWGKLVVYVMLDLGDEAHQVERQYVPKPDCVTYHPHPSPQTDSVRSTNAFLEHIFSDSYLA